MTFKHLPSMNARQVIPILRSIGFVEDRQKGSHLVMYNVSNNTRVVVPIHGGMTIKKPLLSKIIKDTKLSVEEFLKLR